MNRTQSEVNMSVPSSSHTNSSSARRLLTISEAADALRISRSSVYRLFDAGQLAWVQIGSSRRVTCMEIERFITAHTEKGSIMNPPMLTR
jgi:excisionase family DNA binding protein